MLTRAILVWLTFAFMLLGVALYSQDLPFELSALGLSFLFALPLAIATLQGALGSTDRYEYPSAGFFILGLWTLAMAPSFVVDNPEAHITFTYTTQAMWTGRWLYFLWGMLFVIGGGTITHERTLVMPKLVDMVAIAIPLTAALAYLIVAGRFSNYTGATVGTLELGSASSVAYSMAQSSLLAVPALLLLIATRADTTRPRLVARLLFLLSWPLLFLSGGRSQLAYAACGCFFVARSVGLRFRPIVAAGVIACTPVLFFLIFTYRSALHESTAPTLSLGDFMQVAVTTTGEVFSQRDARETALTSFSDNTKLRLWYGTQFFTVVDEWLDNGAGFHGTFLEGIIRSLPSWLFPGKNELADEYHIEGQLLRTGRFPDMDLGPTPWMQWLFELGLVGVCFGAVIYGRWASYIDRRMSKTNSLYESYFWIGMLLSTCSPEQTTDTMLIGARNIGALLIVAYLLGVFLHKVFPSNVQRSASAAIENMPRLTGN